MVSPDFISSKKSLSYRTSCQLSRWIRLFYLAVSEPFESFQSSSFPHGLDKPWASLDSKLSLHVPIPGILWVSSWHSLPSSRVRSVANELRPEGCLLCRWRDNAGMRFLFRRNFPILVSGLLSRSEPHRSQKARFFSGVLLKSCRKKRKRSRSALRKGRSQSGMG